MNRHQRLADYLRHMFDAARKSGVYIDGMERADFLADERTQQAVVLNLVIIGEAATKLLQTHADFLDNYVDVPWKSMKGMRTWLLRHQSRHRLGNGANRSASTGRSLAGDHCSRRGEAMIITRRQPHSSHSMLQFSTLLSSICRSC